MRISAIVLSSVLSLVSLATPSAADVLVTELWHVDPLWEAGGYWELTVTNLSGSGLYMVAVGNNGADLVAVRNPDMVGVWYPTTVNQGAWDLNDWGHSETDWTFPDTSTLPFSMEFPGYPQVLVYYVTGSNPPIPDGSVQTGFYFNYPFDEDVRASGASPASGGSPFLVFGGSGEVVARGETIGAPLSTTTTTWGAVKALYR